MNRFQILKGIEPPPLPKKEEPDPDVIKAWGKIIDCMDPFRVLSEYLLSGDYAPQDLIPERGLMSDDPTTMEPGISGFSGDGGPIMSYRKYQRNLPKFLRSKRG